MIPILVISIKIKMDFNLVKWSEEKNQKRGKVSKLIKFLSDSIPPVGKYNISNQFA
jgi:hypothetical protein